MNIILRLGIVMLLALAPCISQAMEENLNTMPVGDLDLLVIPDADVFMEQSVLPGIDSHPEFLPLFKNGPLPGVVRAYFFKSGDHNVLVDSGWGKDGKIKGNTVEYLGKAGIKPEDVTDILLTHMDIDHIGGLLANGKPVFANARIWVSKPEYAAWNGNGMGKRPERARKLAKDVIERYNGKIQQFDFGQQILPGVIAVDASGHTPGHTAYDIQSGENKLTIAGDFLHVPQAQLPLPELNSVYDLDPEKASAARIRLLERAAKDSSMLAGMHMPMISDAHKRDDHGYMMMEPR